MSSMISLPLDQDKLALLRSRWGWLLAAGLVLIAVGVLALANALMATVASVFFVGTMMLIGGVAQIALAFQVRKWGQFLAWLLIGVLYVAAGLAAFSNPLLASAFLTLLFTLSLIAAGLFRIIAGFSLRPAEGWGWLLTAGIITVIVGGIVLAGWPINSLWLIGALLAFDLLFHGLAFVIFSLTLRRNVPQPDPV